MRLPFRRSPRRKKSSKALTILGNFLLVLVTLGVAGLVVYLVTSPPGAVDPSLSGSDLDLIPSSSAPATSEVPPTTTVAVTLPPPLSLAGACGAVLPVVDRVESVRFDYVNGSESLEPARVNAVATDLQSIRDLSPAELATTIDPLLNQMTAFATSLEGSTQATLDLDAASASEDAIRKQCVF